MLLVSDKSRSITWNYTLFPAASTGPAKRIAVPSGQQATASALGALLPDFAIELGGRDRAGGVVDLTAEPEEGELVSGAAAASSAKVSGASGQSQPVDVTSRLSSLLAYAKQAQAADAVTGTSVTAEPGVEPLTGGCGTTAWTNEWKYNVKEHYMNVYSRTGIPVTLTEGTGGSTSHTIGVVAETNSSGSLSLSGTTSKSYSHSVSQSGLVDKSVSNRVNMRKQAVACDPKSYWKQYSVYDYITDVASVSHVNYDYCSLKSAGSIWSTGAAKSVTWTTGLSFPSISASAQSGFASSQDLAFHFNGAGWICGNDPQGPLASSKVSAR